MLTCRQLTELVTEYLEGRMSLWRRLQVQMHLGMCRHCRAYLRQMKTTVRALGRLDQGQLQMPADLKAELLERLGGMAPPEQK